MGALILHLRNAQLDAAETIIKLTITAMSVMGTKTVFHDLTEYIFT